MIPPGESHGAWLAKIREKQAEIRMEERCDASIIIITHREQIMLAEAAN